MGVKVVSQSFAVGDTVIPLAGLGQVKALYCLASSAPGTSVVEGNIQLSVGIATAAAAIAAACDYDYTSSTMCEGWGQGTAGIVARADSGTSAVTIITCATVTNWGVDTITINTTVAWTGVLIFYGGDDVTAEIVETSVGGGGIANTGGFRPTMVHLLPTDSTSNNAGTTGSGNWNPGVAFVDRRGTMRNVSVSGKFSSAGTNPVAYWSNGLDALSEGGGGGFHVDGFTSNGLNYTRTTLPANCSRLYWLMLKMDGWEYDFSVETVFKNRDTVCTGAYEMGQPDAVLLFGSNLRIRDAYSQQQANAVNGYGAMAAAFDASDCGSVAAATDASNIGSSNSSHSMIAKTSGMAQLAAGNDVVFECSQPTMNADGFTLPRVSSDGNNSEMTRLLAVMMKKVA